MSEAAEQLAKRGHLLAPEQGLPLFPRLGLVAPGRVHRHNAADDHRLAAAKHATAVGLHPDRASALAQHAKGRAKCLATKPPLEVARDGRPVLGVYHVEEVGQAEDLVSRIAHQGGEGVVRKEDTIWRHDADAHQGLMRERLEVLLRLGEEGRSLLQGGDDFVERTGHLAGMAGELPARRGITRGEASRQVGEVGVHGWIS